ncbi:MAG TPA: hypothetical protein VLV45_13075 [Gemmatimonadales bacterium]|nr:hypothetical protein [Gemmatimonadales bacterium]
MIHCGSPVRSLAAIAMMASMFALGACHTWRHLDASQIESDEINRVWVTQADQNTVIMSAPRLFGDTIAGFVEGQYREMPLADTRNLQERVFAAGKTTALGVSIGAVTLTGMIYMANRSYVGDGKTCNYGIDAVTVPCCAGQSTVVC